MSESILYRLREARSALGHAQLTIRNSQAEITSCIQELEQREPGDPAAANPSLGERPEQVDAETSAEVAKT